MKIHYLVLLAFLVPASISAQDKPEAHEPKPIFRAPPEMPWEAETSGYCCMDFYVNSSGHTQNVTTSYCTDDRFAEAAIESVKRWKYTTSDDGRFHKLKTKQTFILVDDYDNVIPAQNWPVTNENAMTIEKPCGQIIAMNLISSAEFGAQ